MSCLMIAFLLLWGAWILVTASVLLSYRCVGDNDLEAQQGRKGWMMMVSRDLQTTTKRTNRLLVEPLGVKPVIPTQNLTHDVCCADRVLEDDFRIGKSCRYKEDHWECRDCGLSGMIDWENCTRMTPNGVCPEFPGTPWDSPRPRSISFYDPTAFHHSTRRILSWYDTKELYEQVNCDWEDDFCFDLSRCDRDGPIKVYAHPVFGNSSIESLGEQYLTRAARMYPDKIERVSQAELACLLVVTCDSYEDFANLEASEAWNQGQNHFVFQSNHCFESHAGRSFQETNYGKAAIATSALTDALLRKHYDVPLARVRGQFHTLQKEFAVPEPLPRQAALQTKRRWLLGYKGKISAHWPHPWWHHRYLAYEYWNTTSDPDVAIDATCLGRIVQYRGKPDYTENLDYNELLSNATFAFCPGGMSVNSFRFAEALGLGSIPVVTPEFLPPFYPDIDWSGCLVTVSEARIADLPRILRKIPHDEIESRQKKCRALFEKTIGWVDQGDQMVIDSGELAFMSSMQLWAHRINKAHVSRQLKSQLHQKLFISS